jgi:hypothetical protein
MAWIIEQVQKPSLVIAHNKTLAAQLCNEFREFFPDNAVEYFVSYYDYYQPEALLALAIGRLRPLQQPLQVRVEIPDLITCAFRPGPLAWRAFP